MTRETITYYRIRGKTIGMRVTVPRSTDYIFQNGEWVPDHRNIIRDHLMGYDPFEEEDSPYRFGSGSILNEIDEIPVEEAMRAIREQSE